MCDYLGHAALRGYAIGFGSYLVQTASDGRRGCERVHGFGALTSGKDQREGHHVEKPRAWKSSYSKKLPADKNTYFVLTPQSTHRIDLKLWPYKIKSQVYNFGLDIYIFIKKLIIRDLNFNNVIKLFILLHYFIIIFIFNIIL